MVPRSTALQRILAVLLVVLCTIAPKSAARQDDADAELQTVTEAELNERIAALDTMEGLDAAARETTVQSLTRALEAARTATQARSRRDELRTQAEEAPALLAAVRAELDAPIDDVPPEVPDDADLRALEHAQTQAQAELDAARQALSELEQLTEQRRTRRNELPSEIATARQAVSDAAATLATMPEVSSEGTSVVQHEAKRAELIALDMAARATLARLEQESATSEGRRELLTARQDLWRRRVAIRSNLVEQWSEIVTQRRSDEARAAEAAAEQLALQETVRRYPVLNALANRSTELAAIRRTTADDLVQWGALLTEMRDELGKLRTDFRGLERRIDASGLNRALRKLLVRIDGQLVSPSELRYRVRSARDAVEDAQLSLIDMEEARALTTDVSAATRLLLEQVEPDDRANAESIARELVTQERQLLEKLVGDTTTLIEQIYEYDATARELQYASNVIRDFIDEHLLWVRSVDMSPSAPRAQVAIAWLTNRNAWTIAWRNAWHRKGEHKGIPVFAVLLVSCVLVRRWMKRMVVRRGEEAMGSSCSTFRPTIWSLLATLVLAAPVPLLFGLLSLILSSSADPDQIGDVAVEHANALAIAGGAGLRTVAFASVTMFVLWELVRPNGLGIAHFSWPVSTIRALRFHLRWAIPLIIPIVFVSSTLEAQEVADEHHESLGRICSMVGWLLISLFLSLIARPNGPILRELFASHPDRFLSRARWLWIPIVCTYPIALVVLAWTGFYYTALQLHIDIRATVAVLLIALLTESILRRWLFITKRRITRDQHRRRLERAREPEVVESARKPIRPPPPDLPALSEQTQRLFRTLTALFVITGMWFIWADELPALRSLDRIQVWPEQQVLAARTEPVDLHDAAVTDAPAAAADPAPARPSDASSPPRTPMGTASLDIDGEDASDAEAEPSIITVANILAAITAIVVTLIANRNIPGLVEIILLRRLPMDAGARYATITILRYVLIVFGTLFAAKMLGFQWSSVQWLVAALTFGLAFGLQEIFANFVSGLIILFEQPVRIGDTVTVGAVTGDVSRIKMRATTLRKWDRTEVVIPNKTFIVGDVTNWTLSDSIYRLAIPVNIAYDADVTAARQALLELAVADDRVLREPPPHVYFKQLGDGGLLLELRVYIGKIGDWVPVESALREAILAKFSELGVEFAFPQHDIRVRREGEG